MTRARTISPNRRMMKVWIAVILTAGLLVVACGDLLVDSCLDNCDNHCESDCRDCGDCIHCLPGMFLLPAFSAECRTVDTPPTFSTMMIVDVCDSAEPSRIDRPPKTLA